MEIVSSNIICNLASSTLHEVARQYNDLGHCSEIIFDREINNFVVVVDKQ